MLSHSREALGSSCLLIRHPVFESQRTVHHCRLLASPKHAWPSWTLRVRKFESKSPPVCRSRIIPCRMWSLTIKGAAAVTTTLTLRGEWVHRGLLESASPSEILLLATGAAAGIRRDQFAWSCRALVLATRMLGSLAWEEPIKAVPRSTEKSFLRSWLF